MAHDSRCAGSSAVGMVPSKSGAGSGLSPAQIASWSLTPPQRDLPGTFVDVMELTEDDLRWLRERPADLGLDADDGLVSGEGEPFWATPGVTPPSVPDPVSPRLAAAQDAIDGLLAGGPLSGSRSDTEALLRLAEQAQAAALIELAEMDAVGGHLRQDLRGTTTATWLRDTLRLSDPVARSTVRLAVSLRDDLPVLGAAVVQGRITVEHARAALDGVRKLDPKIVADAADGIVALAALVDPPSLRSTLRDKAIAIDPKLAEEAARRAEARQGIRVNEVGDHTAIDGTLAGEAGVRLRLALDLGAEKARVEGDTRGRAARNADVIDGWVNLALTREHGPGDSLREDARTIRTHVHVLVTPDQLAAATAQINGSDRRNCSGQINGSGQASGYGQHTVTGLHTGTGQHTGADVGACGGGPGAPPGLAGAGSLAELLSADLLGQHAPAAPVLIGSSTPLGLGALRRLTCDATLHLTVQRDLAAGESTAHECTERPPGAVLGTPPPPGWVCSHQRDPLYVGRSSRTVTGAQFKALIARDRHCVVRGCHRPPSACEAHHARHWADGGSSDLDNLVLLCHAHHHDLHDREQHLPHHDGVRWLTHGGWAQTGWATDPP